MNERPDFEFLRRAAQRAAQRPFFVASDLAVYRELHQMGEEALAEFLGCPLEQLPRLALCRRPDAAAQDFRRAVEQIAAHAGVQPARLVQVLREVEAVHALQGGASSQAGMLLAARDRPEPEEGPSPGQGDTPPADCTNERL